MQGLLHQAANNKEFAYLMLIFITSLLIGFVLLTWSADRFADHALNLGNYFHIPKIVIGIVILGFGTSAPELLVSGISAWRGNPGIAIGNAIGSNITNILLILGVTLCILPLVISKNIILKNYLLLIGATAFFGFVILDNELSRLNGFELLSGLVVVLILLIYFSKNEEIQIEGNVAKELKLSTTLIGLFTGLAVLLISSEMVVWGAASIAEYLQVNDLIIGLTVIALGTSLPELATCVASALKKHSELALGNVVGSNIFNTIGVTGVAGVIASYNIPGEFYQRDFPIMLAATIFLFVISLLFLRNNKIPRSFGLLFIGAYVSYIYLIIKQTI